jgi:hypothetical protein
MTVNNKVGVQLLPSPTKNEFLRREKTDQAVHSTEDLKCTL